jgi:hypothetical protein
MRRLSLALTIGAVAVAGCGSTHRTTTKVVTAVAPYPQPCEGPNKALVELGSHTACLDYHGDAATLDREIRRLHWKCPHGEKPCSPTVTLSNTLNLKK